MRENEIGIMEKIELDKMEKEFILHSLSTGIKKKEISEMLGITMKALSEKIKGYENIE